MTEKEIIIEGYKVRYAEQCGDGVGSVVYVFLHGWGSDYTIFKSLFGLVDCMVAFDFPGFGGSSPLREPWDLAKYAAVLRSFLEQKTVGREVVFVAHSFGGRVLLQMLSQQSKVSWVRRVVCMGVPFVRERRTGPMIWAALQVGKVVLSLFPKSMQWKVRERWCAFVGADDYAALDTPAMKQTFQHVISADMRYLAESLRGYDTVFVWGADDAVAPIADAEVVARDVDARMYPVAGGNHFPFLGDTAEAFQTVFTQHIRV